MYVVVRRRAAPPHAVLEEKCELAGVFASYSTHFHPKIFSLRVGSSYKSGLSGFVLKTTNSGFV